jgi:peroxisomal membrane protein 4
MIAGLIGGYCVWGNYSSINYQIVLYLASRVFVAMVKRLMLQQKRGLSASSAAARIPHFMRDRTYSFCAAMIWGVVLFLYEDSPEVLHPSLKTSMDEIYRFRPWSALVPNS